MKEKNLSGRVIKSTSKFIPESVLEGVILKEKIVKFIATGGYIGYSPAFSGTIGSLVGIGIYLGISCFSPLIYTLFLLLLLIFGTWICKVSIGIFQNEDPPYIVFDEMCGYLVAMFLLPKTPFFIIFSFALFRILDVLKLYPLNIIQKRESGFGVMLDDLVCGVVTNIVLQIIRGFVGQ